MRLAYFFFGFKRKSSIAEELKLLCTKGGFGLTVHEVDVLVGGKEHYLLDRGSQQDWLLRLEDGKFDCIILSPPCGAWCRANWANDDDPKPCRDRTHPLGFPGARKAAQKRAQAANAFMRFSIRAIVQA